jgi:hypothetical protein
MCAGAGLLSPLLSLRMRCLMPIDDVKVPKWVELLEKIAKEACAFKDDKSRRAPRRGRVGASCSSGRP